MESGPLGVILDSSFVIEADRQQLNVAQFLGQIVHKLASGRRHCLPSPLPNSRMGSTGRTRRIEGRRRALLDELKASVPIYPVTENTAKLLGKSSGEPSAKGVTIPVDDLLIGTCALERGYVMPTGNRRHFEKIPVSSSLNYSPSPFPGRGCLSVWSCWRTEGSGNPRSPVAIARRSFNLFV
jgi:hypothetical protein